MCCLSLFVGGSGDRMFTSERHPSQCPSKGGSLSPSLCPLGWVTFTLSLSPRVGFFLPSLSPKVGLSTLSASPKVGLFLTSLSPKVGLSTFSASPKVGLFHPL